MKKTLVIFTVLITLLTLAGCNDVFQPPQAISGPDAGKGYVRLQLGSAAGRTLLPETYEFAAYKFTFTPDVLSDGRKVEEFDDLEDTFVLEIGNWTLAVEVYSDAGDTVPAATATGISLTVDHNTPAQVTVPLVFATFGAGDTGKLTYTITNNTGITPDQLEVILKRLDATQDDYWYYDPVSQAGGYAVPAGYYLATVRLEKDPITSLGYSEFHDRTRFTGAKRAVWSDILHIYPGQTTNVTHTFGPDDFFNGIENIWLFSHMTDWTLGGDLTNKCMTKEADGTFSWKGDATNLNASSDDGKHYFKFSLTDTSQWQPDNDANRKNGAWFVPQTGGTSAVIDGAGNAMSFLSLHHSNPDAVEKSWKLDSAGYYEITVDPVNYRFYVEKPVIVENIAVNGSDPVNKGTSTTYTADVTGKNLADRDVTWSIDGYPDGTPSGTTIGESTGLLTVDGDEALSSLIIKATSKQANATQDSITVGTKTVGITTLPMLATPTPTTLSPAGIATWTCTDHADVISYSLQLYKSATNVSPVWTTVGQPVTEVEALTYDNFLSVMRENGVGYYSFTVTAIGDGINHAPSSASAHSGMQQVTQRTAVSSTYWWDDYAQWDNTDTAGNYVVQLYKDGNADENALGDEVPITRGSIVSGTGTKSQYNAAAVKAAAGVGLYTFKVKAIGNGGLQLDSAWSAISSGDTGVGGYSPFGDSKVWTIVEGVYNGNPRYVAGADGGKIAWSTDKVKWTLATTPSFSSTQSIRGIAYASVTDSGTKERFVAVGYNGKIAYSDNGGVTWTEAVSYGNGSPFDDYGVLAIAYGGGRFLAGGGNGIFAKSDNGRQWTWLAKAGEGSPFNTESVLSIAYGGGIFVAVGSGGRTGTYNPTNDSLTWISDNIFGTGGAANSITYGNSQFVVVGAGGNIRVSPNGTSWSTVTSSPFGATDIQNITYATINTVGRFYAVGNDGKVSYHLTTSNIITTGTNWTTMAPGISAGQTQFFAQEDITAVGFCGGSFIMHGSRKGTATINPNAGKVMVITP